MANDLQKRLETELADYLRVRSDDRQFVAAQVEAGRRADLLGRHEQAVSCFEQALRVNPVNPDARYEHGCQLLLRGRSDRAWSDYRYLFQTDHFERKKLSLRLWNGPSYSADGVVLYSDQGLGDAIQFLRFARLVRPYFKRLFLHAPSELERLFSESGMFDEFLPDPGYRDQYPDGMKSVAAQCYAPLSSLPGVFNAGEQNLPEPTPCRSDPVAAEEYRSILSVGQVPLVGIAWRGKAKTPRDPVRSLPFEEFLPLAEIRGIRLVLIQWGATPDEAGRFERAGGINLGSEISDRQGDFTVTAAALGHLDLVVTCDSVIAHLAGSLGIKTWVALPVASEWRWQLQRPTSPWYRSVRLFRQRDFGDWRPVVGEIANAIINEWRS